MNDKLKFKDRVEIIVHDGDKVTQRLTPREDASIFQKLLGVFGLRKFTHDYVTYNGVADVAQYIYDNYSYISIGSSDLGDSDASYVDLVEPVNILSAVSRSIISTSSYNDTVVIKSLFTVTAATILKETGLHKDLMGGVMFARQTFDAVAVVDGSIVTVIWTIQIMR